MGEVREGEEWALTLGGNAYTYVVESGVTTLSALAGKLKDEIGTAGTHTVRIITSGSQTIDGAANISLESQFAAINLYSDGTSKYFIF